MASKKKISMKKNSDKREASPEKSSPREKPEKQSLPTQKAKPKQIGSGNTPKKEAVRSGETHTVSKFSIYLDEKIQQPLRTPGKDIIKILTRNPYEAYIFWNVLPGTYDKALQFFQQESTHVGLEILLEYSLPDGNQHSQRISVHPLSQNYFCRFLGHVSHLKVSLFAVSVDRSYMLFNSSPVDLPEDKPSNEWDEAWIHPEWLAQGFFTKGEDGKYRLREGISMESMPNEKFQGSSGFVGSSGNSISSGSMGSSSFSFSYNNNQSSN